MKKIINFDDYKKGRYQKAPSMTIGDCIKELDSMFSTATPRQKVALNAGINLLAEYMRGVDDLK